MPTIASQQDLAAAAEPLLQSNRGGATDARQDSEVGRAHACPFLSNISRVVGNRTQIRSILIGSRSLAVGHGRRDQ